MDLNCKCCKPTSIDKETSGTIPTFGTSVKYNPQFSHNNRFIVTFYDDIIPAHIVSSVKISPIHYENNVEKTMNIVFTQQSCYGDAFFHKACEKINDSIHGIDIFITNLDETGEEINRNLYHNCRVISLEPDYYDYSNNNHRRCRIIFKYEDIINIEKTER